MAQVRDALAAVEPDDLHALDVAPAHGVEEHLTAAAVLEDVRADLGDDERDVAGGGGIEPQPFCHARRHPPGGGHLARVLDA